jgi:hypothetical protein
MVTGPFIFLPHLQIIIISLFTPWKAGHVTCSRMKLAFIYVLGLKPTKVRRTLGPPDQPLPFAHL